MAHNEDNDPYLKDLGYFVHARITDASGAVVEDFTHYCYPGILCGDAYGFNNNGVVMTLNDLYPSDVNLVTWAIRECGATHGRTGLVPRPTWHSDYCCTHITYANHTLYIMWVWGRDQLMYNIIKIHVKGMS